MTASTQRFGRASCFALVALALAAMATRAPADEFQLEEGFKRLDNGTNLDGWNGQTDGWSIVDGAIHLNSKEAKGHLYADATHGKSCVIRLQFRATPKADSGVYIWGNQFQVRDYPTAGPQQYASAAKAAGEWNDLEFDITDGVATVKLNGQVIEKDWKIGNQSKKGVGLQTERGDFDFRYVRVKEK
jgi:hypothetical protein